MILHEPRLERLDNTDLDNLLVLADQIGWGLSRQKVHTFLQNSIGFGHRIGTELISSTLCFPYDDQLSFVGLVIVHPDWQRQGIGKAVFEHCLAEAGVRGRGHVRDDVQKRHTPVALVSTNAGYPLYESCGFHTVERLRRHIGRPDVGRMTRAFADAAADRNQLVVEPVEASDLDEIMALDRKAIGASRRDLYPGFLKSTHRGYIAREPFSGSARGEVRGFGFATEFGGELLVLGPLVADHWQTAAKLSERLIGGWRQSIRFDIPDCQVEWSAWVQSIGVPEVHRSALMLYGANELPGNRNCLFGIMDAALG